MGYKENEEAAEMFEVSKEAILAQEESAKAKVREAERAFDQARKELYKIQEQRMPAWTPAEEQALKDIGFEVVNRWSAKGLSAQWGYSVSMTVSGTERRTFNVTVRHGVPSAYGTFEKALNYVLKCLEEKGKDWIESGEGLLKIADNLKEYLGEAP